MFMDELVNAIRSNAKQYSSIESNLNDSHFNSVLYLQLEKVFVYRIFLLI